MSKLFGLILTVGALAVGLFLLMGTEDGRSFTDFFLSEIVSSGFLIVFSGGMLTIFGAITLLVFVLNFSEGKTSSKWPKVFKDESLGIFVKVYENDTIYIDFGGETLFRFKKDSLGRVRFEEEFHPRAD